MLRAIWNGQIIAESPRGIRMGGQIYFPEETMRWDFVRDSGKSALTLKGRANYYVLEVDGSRKTNGAWYYSKTTPWARKVKGHVAFGEDVEVVGET